MSRDWNCVIGLPQVLHSKFQPHDWTAFDLTLEQGELDVPEEGWYCNLSAILPPSH